MMADLLAPTKPHVPVWITPYLTDVSSTDCGSDDGYYFSAYSPIDQVFLATGLRISTDFDMIGGYALLSVAGHQTEVRFNRGWRQDFSLKIGPYSVEFIEPLRKIRVKLDTNDSGMTFDLLWEGASPPWLEEHHASASRGRHMTDRGRYSQPGTADGRITIGDRCWKISGDRWSGSRDHSWGLDAGRAPHIPSRTPLPPEHMSGSQRALRLRTVFRSGHYSGFWHLHELADGDQVEINGAPSSPFGGRLFRGWADETIELRSGMHRIELEQDTHILKRARVVLVDTQGREWRQELEILPPPWLPIMMMVMGSAPSSCGNGGTRHTDHGSEGLAIEWYQSDFLDRPVAHGPYCVGDYDAKDDLGLGLEYAKSVHGCEYLSKITTFAPDGSRHVGAGEIEFFINGPDRPLGLE